MSAFVDTSVWYAAADKSDRNNHSAKRILAASEQWVTTDHVLIETWFLLRYRLGKTAAEIFWARLPAVVSTLESVTLADLENARIIQDNFPDQDFSIVDRTSFAVMSRMGITTVASYDQDFMVYRFGKDKQKAFKILNP